MFWLAFLAGVAVGGFLGALLLGLLQMAKRDRHPEEDMFILEDDEDYY